MGLAGNAYFAADQHFYFGSELLRPLRRQRGIRLHRHDQRHFVLITKIDDGRRAKTPRRRPLDFPCGETCRQLPLDARGLARIAWIDPIDMPALLELKMQTEIEVMPGRNRLILGYEL